MPSASCAAPRSSSGISSCGATICRRRCRKETAARRPRRRRPAACPWWLEAHPRRIAAGIDLAVVVAVAGLVAGLVRIDFWVTLAVTALLYHGVSVALLGCSPTVWALDTYVSTQHPNVVPPVDVSAFRRLGLMRGDAPSPERDTAS